MLVSVYHVPVIIVPTIIVSTMSLTVHHRVRLQHMIMSHQLHWGSAISKWSLTLSVVICIVSKERTLVLSVCTSYNPWQIKDRSFTIYQ